MNFLTVVIGIFTLLIDKDFPMSSPYQRYNNHIESSITNTLAIDDRNQTSVTKGSDAGIPLTVCLINWPVYSFKNNSGQPEGIIVDLIIDFASKTGRKAAFNFASVNRCKREVTLDHIDVFPYVSEDKSILLSKHSIHFHIAGFAVLNNGVHQRYTSVDQFKHQNIGILQGNRIFDVLNNREDIHVIRLNSARAQSGMIQNGRVDAVSSDLVSLSSIPLYKEKKVIFLYPPLGVVKLYFGFSPKNKIAHKQFNRYLEKSMESGKVDALYKKYSSISYQRIIEIANLEKTPPTTGP